MFRRLLSAALVLGLSSASAALVMFEPAFGRLNLAGTQPELQTQVRAHDLQLICPASALLTGGANGTSVGSVSPVGAASIGGHFSSVSEQNGQLTKLIQSGLDGTASSASSVSKSISAQVTLPQVFSVQDPAGLAEQGSGLLNLHQIQLVKHSRLSGLAATNCQRAATDLWFVGGSTAIGREALLVVENASQVDASVQLEIFGAEGQIHSPGQTGIAIAAGATKVIPLSSLADNQSALALHLKSEGGAVAAWLQQKTVRGLNAAGLDLIAPASSPALHQVIPGVFIRGAKDANKLIASNSDYADIKPVLRLFAHGPASGSLTVTAQVVGTTADTFGTVIQQTIPKGKVVDIPINGLADGDYSVFVKSSFKLFAAVVYSRSSLKPKPATDFTWMPAAPQFSSARSFTVSSEGISKLSLANPGSSAIQVRLWVLSSGQQSATVFKVGASSSITISLTNSLTYSIAPVDATTAIAASVVIDVNGAVANLQLDDSKNLGGKVRVQLR